MIYYICIPSESKTYYVEGETVSQAVNKLCEKLGYNVTQLPLDLVTSELYDQESDENEYLINNSTDEYVPIRCALLRNKDMLLFNGDSIDELMEVIDMNPITIDDFTESAMLIK